MIEAYRHKVKTAEQLRALLGSRPRAKKVIMCHGVFDVLHPGHLRHLIYAKSKADILIASLTADFHITKGADRPHVPHDLRALNLAALEMVDYVLTDTNATPIDNIRLIEPDFFAKGYEYIADGIQPKTSEEQALLESYGGEIIFTPGDVVYSSSRLLTQAKPRLVIEKLLMLMDKNDLSFDDLRGVLTRLAQYRVHVVGDTIVDSYTQTTPLGGIAKTPTLSVLYESRKDYVGGAGIVAKHLRAAGAEVVFSTVLGDDAFKSFVLDDLAAADVKCAAVIDPTRPTVNKNAIVANDYRLLKIDTLDNRSISDAVLAKIIDSLNREPCDAVVLSDFRHGIFNRRTIPPLVACLPAGAFRVADSQVASRWGNITEFQGFDLITPNEREARFALGDQDTGVRPLAAKLYDAAGCKTLIMKMGERGILSVVHPEHTQLDSYFVLDSFVEGLVDPVGAGDALLAYSTLAMLATKSPAVAAILGSIAAGCECEEDGNIPITPDRVGDKLKSLERQARFA